eukprot:4392306-Heterocapsa_arctica.AAC.1
MTTLAKPPSRQDLQVAWTYHGIEALQPGLGYWRSYSCCEVAGMPRHFVNPMYLKANRSMPPKQEKEIPKRGIEKRENMMLAREGELGNHRSFPQGASPTLGHTKAHKEVGLPCVILFGVLLSRVGTPGPPFLGFGYGLPGPEFP